MTRAIATTLLLAWAIVTPCAWGQAVKPEPRIGYVYPAGGRQGTTVRVLVGGQFLRGSTAVHISGDGVRGEVIEHYPLLRNLDKEQRDVLFRRMADCAQARWDELVEKGLVTGKAPWNITRKPPAPAEDAEPVTMPKHYLLNDWERMSLRELGHIRRRLTERYKQQPNPQIGETVLVELTIDAGAAPGDRELRLIGRAGLTNPMVFQVGKLPEVAEVETNDPRAWDPLPPEPPLDLPVVINGQILPGDVDQLRFNARAGESLVIRVQARHLVPFMADAVPGWFQPVICVRNAKGKELAFADDYRFDPDPVLRFVPPADGVYTLEIHDAIYRGREDFVYRVAIGELPFVTSVFPLGGQAGKQTPVTLSGWNLPVETVSLQGDVVGLHALTLDGSIAASNAIFYVLDDQAGRREGEPNNVAGAAQHCELPTLIDGRIDAPGDVDVYQFAGRAGQRIVTEVIARRLRSPMDSLIRLTDAQGKVIAWNDDHVDKQGHLHRTYGALTHQADSYLAADLPADGIYRLIVSDATRQGGPAYVYRLRIGEPKPDFDVRIGPSSVNVVTGQSTPLAVHVLRRDGFTGPVTLKLVDPPEGFTLDGAEAPAGVDTMRVTLTAPVTQSAEAFPLVIEARAVIGDQAVTHPATPVDDVMQAFLWRHLVPAEQTLVQTIGPNRMPPAPKRVDPGRLQLHLGEQTAIRFKAFLPARAGQPQLQLSDPPDGVSLKSVEVTAGQITATIATSKEAKVGLAGNLIIEFLLERTWKNKEGQPQKRMRPVGVLRAVPYFIVE